MSLPVNISDLLHQRVVEGTRIEYKSDWNPEPILHSICAFANDIDNCGGGYIIIGVEEKDGIPVHPIKGLEKSSIDRIQKELLQKCNLLEPRYLPIVEVCSYDGKDLIVIWAYGGEVRPYRCPVDFPTEKSRHFDKAYYIRKMASSIRANINEERELILLAGKTPFDDQMNRRAELTDLKTSLIGEFLNAVGSDLYRTCFSRPICELGEDMRIIDGTTEYCKPLNVGLMFFNENPEKWFREARIEIVDKPEPTGEHMQEQYFTGPLDKQLRDALRYIRNYMLKIKITKIDGQAEALHTWNLPYKAIEEALANAVYHKAYDIAEPITITLTPDYMEILSVPGPDHSISFDDLKRFHLVSKRYRNRRIGNFLKELQLVEGRNTGIPAIVEAMKKNGSEPPRFETDEKRSYFSVILPVHPSFRKEQSTISGSNNNIARKRRSSAEIKQLIQHQLEVNGPMSMHDLAIKLGYVKITNTMSRIVRQMLHENLLRLADPEHPHSRSQQLILL